LRYRLHYRAIPGATRSIDIAFPRLRLAIYIDGCFWHGCPVHGTTPKTNTTWWIDKIQRNTQRDRDTDARLSELGWHVMRFWEHQGLDEIIEKIVGILEK